MVRFRHEVIDVFKPHSNRSKQSTRKATGAREDQESAVNTVRIIGGAWRRRVLRFPDADGLRPTPDQQVAIAPFLGAFLVVAAGQVLRGIT